MTQFASLLSGGPKAAVVSPNLASRFGASFVFGLPADLIKLEAAAPFRAVNEAMFAKLQLGEGAREWIRSGEQGMSSLSLFYQLTGYFQDAEAPGSYVPADPSDLRRCILMLDACGLHDRLKTHGFIGSWARLMDKWHLIYTMFLEEAPNYKDKNASWKAPKTFALLKTVNPK